MGPYVETTESAASALLVLSQESILVRITLCDVDTPRDGMTAQPVRATWGARCGKSARRVLRGGTGTSGLPARLVPTHHSIPQNNLMELVKERISDRRVVKLIRQWLKAGVMEDGTVRETLAGTPQGGVISPLLANIYLHELDRTWAEKHQSLGVLVRYADDFVVMSQKESQAKEALRQVTHVMGQLGLTLHPEKTRLVDVRYGKESFVFLGCTVGKRRSVQRNPRRHFMQRCPSPKAINKLRTRVHELTDARRSG